MDFYIEIYVIMPYNVSRFNMIDSTKLFLF